MYVERNCPKYKAKMKNDQSSKTNAITVMAVDESDILQVALTDGKLE